MNDACCSRPLISTTYDPVGKDEKLKDGMNVYVAGPANAERAIVYIYDAFGYTQQQRLGADLLAASLSARVFMPDFFRGEHAPTDSFPTDTEEKKEKLMKWFGTIGNLNTAAESLPGIVSELKQLFPSAKKWASIGFCWGGKIVALTSQDGTPFDVSSACHPGRMDPAEAKAFTIPHVCLLSGEDGTPDEKEAYKKALNENGQDVYFDVFQDQVHGWMAARADLNDEKVKKEFERGYDTVATFFKKHM